MSFKESVSALPNLVILSEKKLVLYIMAIKMAKLKRKQLYVYDI